CVRRVGRVKQTPMAQTRTFRPGPTLLTPTLTANTLSPPVGSGGVGVTATNQYMILRHIRIVNRSATAATFSLWLGATGANTAGTEVLDTGGTIAGNSFFEWFGLMRLDAADFLVGGSNTASALVILIEGELGVAG